MDLTKSLLRVDLNNEFNGDSDIDEKLNFSHQYCLGKVFSRRVTKIEELECNQKLLVSSYESRIKIGWSKFDTIKGSHGHHYFVLNNKKDIILACDIYSIGIYFMESKLHYHWYYTSKIKSVAFVENFFVAIAFENINYIRFHFWENFLLRKEKRIKCLVGHTSNINILSSVNNDHLLSGSDDSTIKYWKISTLECIQTFVGHRGFITCLKLLSPKIFVSGSYDTTIKIWDLESRLCLKTFVGHQNYLVDIQETKNGQIVSLDCEGVLNFWNVKTGCRILSLSDKQNDMWSCFRILDSGELVTGSVKGLIHIWSKEKNIRNNICSDKEAKSKTKTCSIL